MRAVASVSDWLNTHPLAPTYGPSHLNRNVTVSASDITSAATTRRHVSPAGGMPIDEVYRVYGVL